MAVDPARVKSLFLAASDLPDTERSAFLDRECGTDDELRARVVALLAANSFLPPPEALPDPSIPTTVSPSKLQEAADMDFVVRDQPNTVIAGKYTLVEVIGEGGMGSVWRARQTEPVKRFVAVKLIKAGMDTKQVLARFEAERQALAMMDHPNIAKVLDGGLHDHRPFFVMELVKGVPITEYCDQQRLTPRQRLELFVQACQAIQHAHQKGIIHRDIKPNNVLVALYDDRPVVKVIDFGVAKATGAALTERTIDTGFGGIVGTPQYMSPEQATFNNLDIDTRSDVYALGVLLYELLTGSPPFSRRDLEHRGLLEMLRVVREVEPPRPSTKVSTADTLPMLSANRGTEPKKLTGLLRNELDWIVMKALEKDRTRRYETANGFAADILRHLNGEAVQAHPPSTAYRLKKFVRRNRPQVIAAGLVALVLLGGIIGTGVGMVRANAEARKKEQAAQAAEASFQQTRQAVDDFFTLVSQSDLFDVPGLEPLRKELLEKARDYYQELAASRGDEPSVLAGLAVANLRMAQVYRELGENDDSVTAFGAGVAASERLLRDFPDARDHHRKLSGFFKGHRGKTRTQRPVNLSGAMQVLQRGVEIWGQLMQSMPEEQAFRSDLAVMRCYLAAVTCASGRFEEGLRIFEEVIAELEPLQNNRDPRLRESLAVAYGWHTNYSHFAGRKPPAKWEGMEEAILLQLAADYPEIPAYQPSRVAEVLARASKHIAAGETREAEALFQAGVQLLRQLVVRYPNAQQYWVDLAKAHTQLGTQLAIAGRAKDADAAQVRAIEALDLAASDGQQSPTRRAYLAWTHKQNGETWTKIPDGANRGRVQLLRAIAIYQVLAVEVPDQTRWQEELMHCHRLVAFSAQTLGKNEEAEEHFRAAIAVLEKMRTRQGPTQLGEPWLSDTYLSLALALSRSSRPAEAAAAFRQSLMGKEHPAFNKAARTIAALPEAQFEPLAAVAAEFAQNAARLAPEIPDYWATLGAVRFRTGLWAEAISALTKSVDLDKGGGPLQWLRLAIAYARLGQADKARSWLDRADAWFSTNSTQDKELNRLYEEAKKAR